MSVLIKGMEMPKHCWQCKFHDDMDNCIIIGENCVEVWGEYRRLDNCPLIPVPDHGRLIDGDTLVADLKRQCKEVFKTDAVSPNDFWITRNQAYNERLWTTWCESLFDYLKAAPTIIPADHAVMHYPQVPGITPTVIAEEVYDKYTDTAGNIHWTGTHSGKHIIPADKEGEG